MDAILVSDARHTRAPARIGRCDDGVTGRRVFRLPLLPLPLLLLSGVISVSVVVGCALAAHYRAMLDFRGTVKGASAFVLINNNKRRW